MNMKPSIYIEKQTSVMRENVKGEEILVVVKQCNFILTVSSQTEVLDGAEICCELLYDSPDFKPVSYINQPPIKYKALQASDKSLNIECKLNVLSSKHEDHFFRVKVTVLVGDRNIGSVLSSPIRCISKLDPHKKEMIKKKKITENRLSIVMDEKKPKSQINAIEIESRKDKMIPVNSVMALLSQNTQFIEEIKKRQVENNNMITSMEYGFHYLIQKYRETGRRRNLLNDAISQLNEKELNCLQEIVNVSDNVRILNSENERRRNDYDYAYQQRMDPMAYQNVSQFQQQHTQQSSSKFPNYRNPFL